MCIIKKYFEALNINNPSATFNCIKNIIEAHLAKFPFTSIPVLLGTDIHLDIDSLIKKIVIYNKGGYCFEHNKLFYSAMKHLNLQVTPLLARVILNRDTIPPKTHRITILQYENNQYLIDVGNSYYSLPTPIKLDGTKTKTKLGQVYRVKKKPEGIYELQYLQNNSIFVIYQFTFQKCYEVDFGLSNFYSYNHPDATFVNNLVLSKIFSNKIISLRNNTFYKIFSNNAEQSDIKDIDSFKKIIIENFEYPISNSEVEFLYNKFVNKNNNLA